MNWFSNSGSLAELALECVDYSERDIRKAPVGFPTEDELLFGEWDEDSYEGRFYLLWRRNGELYEESMSHCSCNDYVEDEAGWATLKPINGAYLQQRAKPFYQYGDAEAYKQKLVAWDAVLEVV